VRELGLRVISSVTRRVHPKGTERLLRRLHRPGERGVKRVVRLRNGFEFELDTANYIDWRLFFFGEYEPEIDRLVLSHLHDGDIAIDVGANIGVHTCTMARAVGPGRVLALEPHPDLFRRLNANLARNMIENVTILSQAALTEIREVELHLAPRESANPGMSSLLALGDWPSVKVEGTTLDAAVDSAGLPRVDLIKADVEGYEGAVLAGAQSVLARFQPLLVFEFDRAYWAEAGYSLESVLEDLKDKGYEHFFEVAPTGLIPVSDNVPAFMNLCAATNEQRFRLR
jgi:FkbM family methyltransferase